MKICKKCIYFEKNKCLISDVEIKNIVTECNCFIDEKGNEYPVKEVSQECMKMIEIERYRCSCELKICDAKLCGWCMEKLSKLAKN